MRCAICDSDSDSVTLTEPCGTCQEVIHSCLAEYEVLDETIVEEDFDIGC